ncbi:MAG: acVLRF1 family peptidyl-tRNA hydrolase [Actinomycetota bacterium]
MTGRPAAGGGRHVDVAPERLEKWLSGFVENHGAVVCDATPALVRVIAADGALAECEVPFPPLAVDHPAAYADLVAHALRPRRIGVLLVRLGGYAVGVFEGSTLVSSKVGSRQVHGRSAAGGWSQQRFARRREGQARDALSDAADTAVRILLPVAPGPALDAIVLGGDKRAVSAVMEDPRLASLRPRVQPRVIDVPDPRLRVLQDSPRLFRSVRIRVVDP